MLKRAYSAVQKDDSISESYKNDYVLKPISRAQMVSLDSYRELNNFKRVEMSNEMNNLIKGIVDEVSAKQEALINKYRQNQITNLKLVPTANPMFMKSADGAYYRLNQYEYVKETSVISVDEAGHYEQIKAIENSKSNLILTYDSDNKVIALRVVNSLNEVCKSEKLAAKKLNMKRELVYPNKLHGYSGNSSGIIAKIKNLLSAPIPSGCYFDKSYSFFKWNAKNSQFELNVREGKQLGSPMMSDYEIKTDVVLRTDYDGAGMVL